MKTTLKNEFINNDHSFDTEKAIEAGHDARTTAIKEFAVWISSAFKGILYYGQMQQIK